MKIDQCDALDCSFFVLLATAEVTDHYVTEVEINGILEKGEALALRFKWYKKPITHDILLKKINQAFEWYDHVGELAPKGKMNGAIKRQVFEVTKHMKKQTWFSDVFAQTFIKDLVALADADGETIKKERKLINQIAELWHVDHPFH